MPNLKLKTQKSRIPILVGVLVMGVVGIGYLIFACSKPAPKTPEAVALDYYRAVIEQNSNQVFDLLSQKDKAVLTQEKLNQVFHFARNPFVKSLSTEISSRMKSALIERQADKNKLLLEFEFTLPDLKGQNQDFLKILFSGKSQNQIRNELSQKIKEVFAQKDLPVVVEKRKIRLVKEADSWKIYLGWGSDES